MWDLLFLLLGVLAVGCLLIAAVASVMMIRLVKDIRKTRNDR